MKLNQTTRLLASYIKIITFSAVIAICLAGCKPQDEPLGIITITGEAKVGKEVVATSTENFALKSMYRWYVGSAPGDSGAKELGTNASYSGTDHNKLNAIPQSSTGIGALTGKYLCAIRKQPNGFDLVSNWIGPIE
ncbi:MAG: hypothetical protein LBD22_00825 [Spirochaetaceae bacterium]|jgi:hypothetical protein|nr:hypothetical protein [Spirochaetaceae bacterium]